MSESKTYNGWSNYETWCVNLWLTNEEGSSRELDSIIRGARNPAQAVKEWVEEMMPELGATLWADMLGAAFSEVDWYEIAENHKDDEPDEADSDEASL